MPLFCNWLCLFNACNENVKNETTLSYLFFIVLSDVIWYLFVDDALIFQHNDSLAAALKLGWEIFRNYASETAFCPLICRELIKEFPFFIILRSLAPFFSRETRETHFNKWWCFTADNYYSLYYPIVQDP